MICTITERQDQYASEIHEKLHKLGYEVELDSSNTTISKKIRNATMQRFNLILIVGDEE